MSCFRISNSIFNLGLTAQEMAVYVYMSSIYSTEPTLDGTAISVKQTTIAQKCGIKAAQTVSKVITQLCEKELITPIKRNIKANKHKGTYQYTVKQLPTKDSYFYVDRYVFGKLTPTQMFVYLFLCKAFSSDLNDSWNSFNDISEQTGMKRTTIIRTVAELEAMSLIRRSRRKSKENRRVYVDNHYYIIRYVIGRIRKSCKKIARMYCEYIRTESMPLKNGSFNYTKNSTFMEKCQVVTRNSSLFFSARGSP